MMKIIKQSILAIAVCCAANSYGADTNQQLTLSAQAAFAKQNYAKALEHYQTIHKQAASYENSYAMAVCYFKLKQWGKAHAIFANLAGTNPEDEWVEINLALTLAKMGRIEESLQRLLSLASLAESEYVATLAYSNYKKISAQYLEHSSQQASQASTILSASLGVGIDSNVVSFVDEVARYGNDTFIELSASTAWYSSADYTNNFVLDANFYSSKYTSTADYNVDVLSFGGRKNFAINEMNMLNAGLRLDQVAIGGEAYMRSANLELGGKWKLQPGAALRYGLRYQMASVLDDIYQPYAGNSLRFKLDWAKRDGPHRWQMKYQWDNENKNDGGGAETDAGFTTFSSYSATRHLWAASWDYTHKQWNIKPFIELRKSQYKDPHIFSDDTQTLRIDDKKVVGLELNRALSEHWDINVDLRSSNNNSAIESYSYNQNMITLTLGWQN